MLFLLIPDDKRSRRISFCKSKYIFLFLLTKYALNGLFFKFYIFPRLKQLVDSSLTAEKIKKISWRLAFSGTVSILSWYSIFVITQLPRTFRPHILYFAGTYLILLVLGILVSKLLIDKIIGKS